MAGSELRWYVSTAMAPVGPSSSPAALAKATLGFTPTARMARSKGTCRPLRSTAVGPGRSPPVSFVTPSLRMISAPASVRACWRGWAISGSNELISWPSSSTTVTLNPRARSCSAHSSPTYPPPMIRARGSDGPAPRDSAVFARPGASSSIRVTMASASGTVRQKKRLAQSASPSIAGLIGTAPVASTSRSYPSASAAPDSPLSSTLRRPREIDTTSAFSRTSTLYRLPNLRGLVTNRSSRRGISPPT